MTREFLPITYFQNSQFLTMRANSLEHDPDLVMASPHPNKKLAKIAKCGLLSIMASLDVSPIVTLNGKLINAIANAPICKTVPKMI